MKKANSLLFLRLNADFRLSTALQLSAVFLLSIALLWPGALPAQSKKQVKAAEAGDAAAQYELGLFYLKPDKKVYNPHLAFEWIRKAAAAGYARAQYQLGYMYFVDGKTDEAVEWSKAAALQGHAGAQTNLFVHYRNNNEPARALEWGEKAMKQGDARAYYLVGQLYFNGGEGVAQDYARAFEYFSYASARGRADAKVSMGVCLLGGLGCEKDERQAFLSFTAAAEKGSLEAKQYLVKCYREGLGVEKNEKKAKALEKEIDLATLSLPAYTQKYWNEGED